MSAGHAVDRRATGLRAALLVLTAFASIGAMLWVAWLAAAHPVQAILDNESQLSFLVRYQGPKDVRLIAVQAPLAVQLDELPDYLPEIFQFQEDRRYAQHPGIDLRGILRALRDGRGGGSTIPQQLVKNTLLQPGRGRWSRLLRKCQELPLTLFVSRQLDKQRLMQVYLNRVPFGRHAHGIEAAARLYFGKRAAQLNPLEVAILAQSLKAPNVLNYAFAPQRATANAQALLAAMHDAGQLSWVGSIAQLSVQPGYRRWHRLQGRALFDALRPEILASLRLREAGDYRVVSSIDPELQTYAELAVQRAQWGLQGQGADQAAVVVMDTRGHLRALVGTADWSRSQFNHARSPRQVGSTLKPFIVQEALLRGWAAEDPLSGAVWAEEGYAPRNHDGRYPDDLTLEDALVASVNTAAVRLQETLGRDTVLARMRKALPNCRLPDEPGLALGSGECTLMDLVRGYASFAGLDPQREALAVRHLRDTHSGFGWSWYAAKAPRPEQNAQPALRSMLAGVIQRGTGQAARVPGHLVWGKTGTTQDYRDAWFIGGSTDLIAGVWVGNSDNRPTHAISGGGLPAQIWQSIMQPALDFGWPTRAALD